jgi:hypothetical protein
MCLNDVVTLLVHPVVLPLTQLDISRPSSTRTGSMLAQKVCQGWIILFGWIKKAVVQKQSNGRAQANPHSRAPIPRCHWQLRFENVRRRVLLFSQILNISDCSPVVQGLMTETGSPSVFASVPPLIFQKREETSHE